MIPKGTMVRVTTTNGGDSVATLAEDYRPTFTAFLINEYGMAFTIDPYRLKTIEAVEAK